MNLQRFKNLWKYHYKKYLALFFTITALILLIGAGAYDVYLSYGQSADGMNSVVSDFFSIWDFALFAVAYMLILIGNLQGSTLAYQGMLMYVFMTLFSAGSAFVQNGFLNIGVLASGDSVAIVLYLFILLFYAAIIVTGVMTYIRTTQYLRNTYANYIGLRTWCLLFVIFNVLLYGFEPAYFLVVGRSVSVLLLVLEPLSQVFISLAIFFTVSRLKTEY
jgi:hypothetical protein